MSSILPKSVTRLSQVLATLPSIGPKTANRLTFYLLSRGDAELENFGKAFLELRDNLKHCSQCHIVCEQDPCPICQDSSRDKDKLAVVEESLDVVALEKARFNGHYHVLGGQISPINNVGPADLNIDSLLSRLAKDKFSEVILATDPSLEGEATALYINDQVQSLIKESKIPDNIKVTRLARGLPVGGDLEYADELTLSRALEGRHGYK